MAKPSNTKYRNKAERAEAFSTALNTFSHEIARAIEGRLGLRRGAVLKKSQCNPDLLNAEKASNAIGVSIKTLANWRCAGSGPEFRKIGSRVFYRRSDLMRYRKARQFKNTSEYRSGTDNGGLEQ